ncbi:hypothetical protein FRB91_007348 [Serendipita sp. 411]|nr:hypothetical protein FRC15_004868 [Serendipita sp. 397]KAG8782325.1 hypothetical protein FRC16_002640 [Serendipita sp. 398]KAG8838865.1 hypothetical protein FRB91_007348 [Serendipita sp. 411]KAG8846740.1 hypothetical protein FRC20_002919 [Serendipita sp. 405]
MISAISLVTVAAAFGFSTVNAQTSNAQCVYASWANNGDNQNPCEIWATLGSKCGGSFTVEALPAPTAVGVSASYGVPGSSGAIPANDCQCNHIAYSLMAACAWCQADVYADSWYSESEWAAGCSNYGNTTIASTVDTSGMNIPPYSLEPIPGPVWDPTDAQAAQVRLGSSGTATGSTGTGSGNGSGTTSGHGSGSTGGNGSGNGNGNGSGNGNGNGSGNSGHVGKAVGAVVGVVALAPLVLLF